ncbi:phosphate ABC transporter substrate-binding protein PstS [Phreatobacter aquaticus]|uniref:Phosphate-binding protein PstS n=1 Tax=Phreatobacter aquaticus TaxID=2570229 RepID=A0A4D7QJL1_9HYPH|nr:phosphate ABC transporter substrate-binding protein PstS [Phreatobacter aquaticus]QCK86133.1 phosphate ABC transporter substrate-binding protein PstS [Phreatobacter aquaticus]
MFSRITTAAALIAATLFAQPAAAQSVEFTGAGATFPAPVYAAWASAYKAATNNTLNYQPIGSGAGITQIQNRTVDFGASDAPVPAARLTQQRLVQFPAVIGAIVMVVNLDGVNKNQLKLTGEIVADIYMGVIKTWNDPRIVALNPGVNLPALAVQPIYRSDGSGTTFVFTSYLSEVSAKWKTDVSAATSVQWKAGAGARGNDGVAGAVRNTKGAIGYVEYAFAAENAMVTTQLQNVAGQFVPPSTASFQAAAAAADWDNSTDLAATMLNRPGAQTWPIVSSTYILIPRDPRDAGRAKAALDFFAWALSKPGDDIAEKLHYIPLPDAVVTRVKAAWANVRNPQGQPVWTGATN